MSPSLRSVVRPSALLGALVAVGAVLVTAAPVTAAPVTAAPAAAAKAATPSKPASSSWVVLVHPTGAVPPAWIGALQDAARNAGAPRRFVPPPTATLDELQLALGCDHWNNACAGLVAEAAGASAAVVLDVAADGAVVVDARIVGSDGAVQSSAERLTLSSTDETDRKAAIAWVVGLVRGARPAVLVVTTDLAGDELLVDDLPAGRTPATVVDVAPGPHRLQVRRPGRAPLLRTVNVVAGQTLRENLVLAAPGPATLTAPTLGADGAPPPLEVTSSTSSWAWGLTGLGALAAVVGGVFSVTHGLPVLEAYLNQTDTGLQVEYEKFPGGGTVSGAARFDYLAERFGTDAATVRDQGAFQRVVENATVVGLAGASLLVVGVALTGAGIGLFATAPDEGARPAAAPAAKAPVATPAATPGP